MKCIRGIIFLCISIFSWGQSSYVGFNIGEGTGVSYEHYNIKGRIYRVSLEVQSLFYDYRVLYGLNGEILKDKSRFLLNLYTLDLYKGVLLKEINKFRIYYYYGGQISFLPRYWYRTSSYIWETDSLGNRHIKTLIVSDKEFSSESLLLFRFNNGIRLNYELSPKFILSSHLGIAFDLAAFHIGKNIQYNGYRFLWLLPQFGLGINYKINTN